MTRRLFRVALPQLLLAVAVLGAACTELGIPPSTAAPEPTATTANGIEQPTPTPTPTISTPTPTPEIRPVATSTPDPSDPNGLLLRPLTEVPPPPPLDMHDIAARLLGELATPVVPTGPPPGVGHEYLFWALNVDNRSAFRVPATLRFSSEHALFYVQDGLRHDITTLRDSALALEDVIVPTLTELLGAEWIPERVTILHGRIPGVAGYFSSADEYAPTIFANSNFQTMLYINVDAVPLGSDEYLATLAHELQHAAHWRADSSENAWINEGLAEIARKAAGYGVGFVGAFTSRPDTSLVHWAESPTRARANYGASTLFLEFLREHYLEDGDFAALMANPGDGIEGVQALLDSVSPGTQFAEVFQEWAVANYLDGRGQPELYPDRDLILRTEQTIMDEGQYSGDVNQYAADYIEVRPNGRDLTIEFRGRTTLPLLPAEDSSGQAVWWSNRGDHIDTTLTRTFDLRDVQSATLEFEMWANIEESWDFAYVEVSVDGSETWTVLEGLHTSEANPVGQSFGPGYTGRSGGGREAVWVEERIDLSAYAGQHVLVRFEYVTDDVFNHEGFALRRISVPEVGYLWEGEGTGGWNGSGFVRTLNLVVQDYRVKVIRFSENGDILVSDLELDENRRGKVTIHGADGTESAVLVVIASAPGTSLSAPYTLDVTSSPNG